jgi:hypothetical protein
MPESATCPVCGAELPPAKPRGRPTKFWPPVCADRARQRRREAARILEYAQNVEGVIGRPGFGSEEYLRRRVASLRADAEELLASIGEPSDEAAKPIV